jgi:hypothetical protein
VRADRKSQWRAAATNCQLGERRSFVGSTGAKIIAVQVSQLRNTAVTS